MICAPLQMRKEVTIEEELAEFDSTDVEILSRPGCQIIILPCRSFSLSKYCDSAIFLMDNSDAF